ncbi:IS5 family transposase [Streptomyces noursei]|uniref:IS5 family transposase n=1 Tax=Streptomyces noursei TaxID=1971 RepID=UPI00199BDC2A|nr:IS5 family transposase [Streptomyces noursei]MCZ1020273.1 IS5 family transposase [Streptomyces noursei]GGX41517.1 DDE transposase [Streptomyces noursei]
MGEGAPYLSDLSDETWELIRPIIAAWKGRHPSVSGHKGSYAMREIVNAILYHARTGCQWRYLPHDLPPYGAVYYYFAKWCDDGTAETIHDLLRWQVREMRRRREDPTTVVPDTQTARASVNAPKETTGLDPGKKSPGRKRGIATDVLGLIIAVVVTAANVHDNAICIALLDKVATSAPTVTKAWTDAGFKNAVVEHGARLGIDVETVRRQPGAHGFAPEPKRWVVEQTFGTLMLHRRLARDYETKPASSVAVIRWSMTDVMLRRLTRTSSPTWCHPPARQSAHGRSRSVDEGTPGQDRGQAAAGR